MFSKREIIIFPDHWRSGVKEPRSQRKGRTEKWGQNIAWNFVMVVLKPRGHFPLQKNKIQDQFPSSILYQDTF